MRTAVWERMGKEGEEKRKKLGKNRRKIENGRGRTEGESGEGEGRGRRGWERICGKLG